MDRKELLNVAKGVLRTLNPEPDTVTFLMPESAREALEPWPDEEIYGRTLWGVPVMFMESLHPQFIELVYNSTLEDSPALFKVVTNKL